MNNISSKQAFYGLLASLALALVGTGYIMYWGNAQLEDRNAQINEKRLESQELEDKTTRAQGLREQLNELSDIAQISSDVLPSSKSQENIVGELLSLASGRGVTLSSISFGGGGSSTNPETSQAKQVKEIPGVFSIDIQTSIQTDYENILQFLEDVEENKRQFEVTDISIAPIAGTPDQFNAQLTLVTYIKP